MKKHIKLLITTVIVAALFVNMFIFNVAAKAKVSVGGGEYNVGQSVSISIKLSNDTPIMTAQLNVSYNSSVLTLKSVSGAEYTKGNGTINIVDDDFSTATKDVKTGSYTLNFTATAAGNSNITVSANIADKNLNKITANGSAAVSVVTPKPSSNANLASLKLSSGSLSPAFSAKTTNYSATVKYSVDSITISASAADGGATCVGRGTFALEVGDNSRTVTVTAADGSKKSYTINIKRLSEAETTALEEEARDADPLLVIMDGVDYRIVNDLSEITVPAGFTKGVATRKDNEIAVLNDEHGKYQLFWITDASGENGAFYTRDEADRFTAITYVNANGKMYIVEDFELGGAIPAGYKTTKCVIDGVEADAIGYEDEQLKDFYIVNCYVDGETAHYRFDTLQGTVQRAVDYDIDFTAANTEVPQEQEEPEGFLGWFKGINSTGKTIFIIIVVAAVALIVLAVLLIVKIATSSRDDYYDDEIASDSANEFILNDFAEDIDFEETAQVNQQESETTAEQKD